MRHVHKALAFADDVGLLADSRDDLEHMATTLQSAASKVGLQINSSKTKYMTVSKQAQVLDPLCAGDDSYEQVTSFKYLGSTVTTINDLYTEVDLRIQSALRAFFSLKGLFRSKKLSLRLKAKLYKVMVRPVLLYGCESWTPTVVLENRLQVCENRMLRWIVGPVFDRMLGIWRGRPNEELRRLCQINPAACEIRSRRLRWAGHAARSDARRAVRTVLDAKVVGKRPRGRPRLRWVDLVKRDCQEQRVVAWRHVAQDRDRWRSLVQTAKGL